MFIFLALWLQRHAINNCLVWFLYLLIHCRFGVSQYSWCDFPASAANPSRSGFHDNYSASKKPQLEPSKHVTCFQTLSSFLVVMGASQIHVFVESSLISETTVCGQFRPHLLHVLKQWDPWLQRALPRLNLLEMLTVQYERDWKEAHLLLNIWPLANPARSAMEGRSLLPPPLLLIAIECVFGIFSPNVIVSLRAFPVWFRQSDHQTLKHIRMLACMYIYIPISCIYRYDIIIYQMIQYQMVRPASAFNEAQRQRIAKVRMTA